MAFKMKGSPFQRNFGIGSPMKNYKAGYYNDDEVSGFKKTGDISEKKLDRWDRKLNRKLEKIEKAESEGNIDKAERLKKRKSKFFKRKVKRIRNESAFKTHEGPDKPHKPTKFDKFAKKVGEYSAKISLGPILGGTKWMRGKTDKPNIVKAIDFVKSKFNKKKDE